MTGRPDPLWEPPEIVNQVELFKAKALASFVQELRDQGIFAADVKKLINAGYTKAEQIAFSPRDDILAIRGIGEIKAQQIIAAAWKMVPSYLTAPEYFKAHSSVAHIPTGSKELDRILNGGIETRSITELFGVYGTGKTQLCHTLAVTCQLPNDQNAFGGKCMYIDTESTFQQEIILAVGKRYGLSPNKVLNNVYSAEADSTATQMQLITKAEALFRESRYALLIIDCTTALYRRDFHIRLQATARQAHLAESLHLLLKLAYMNDIAVVVTDLVVPEYDVPEDEVKRIGGAEMDYACSTQLYLHKDKSGNRFCKVHKSENLPSEEAMFAIYNDGIGDV